jgi:nucleoid DNA-binding protein
MSKALISTRIAIDAAISQAAAERAFDAFIDAVVDEAKAGNDVTIEKLGRFYVHEIPAHDFKAFGHTGHVSDRHYLRFNDSRELTKVLTEAREAAQNAPLPTTPVDAQAQPAPEVQQDANPTQNDGA